MLIGSSLFQQEPNEEEIEYDFMGDLREVTAQLE